MREMPVDRQGEANERTEGMNDALDKELRLAITAALGSFGNTLVANESEAANDFNKAIARMTPQERLSLGRVIIEAANEVYRD